MIPFRGGSNPLSNWYPVPLGVPYGGERYKLVEHGYKSVKAEYYGLDDLPETIKDIKSAKEVMELVDSKIGEEKCGEWTKEKSRPYGIMTSGRAAVFSGYIKKFFQVKEVVI